MYLHNLTLISNTLLSIAIMKECKKAQPSCGFWSALIVQHLIRYCLLAAQSSDWRLCTWISTMWVVVRCYPLFTLLIFMTYREEHTLHRQPTTQSGCTNTLIIKILILTSEPYLALRFISSSESVTNPPSSSLTAVEKDGNKNISKGSQAAIEITSKKFAIMRILYTTYTTQCWSTTRVAITTALYCNHLIYIAGRAQRNSGATEDTRTGLIFFSFLVTVILKFVNNSRVILLKSQNNLSWWFIIFRHSHTME